VLLPRRHHHDIHPTAASLQVSDEQTRVVFAKVKHATQLLQSRPNQVVALGRLMNLSIDVLDRMRITVDQIIAD
jgi:hypothetical protein